MSPADAIEAHAHVIKPHLGDAAHVALIYEGAIGGQRNVETHPFCPSGDVEDVRAQQRLAAGQDEHRYAKRLEVIHHAEDLPRRQLARKVLVGGDRIAVLACEVAATDQVPDHHGAGRMALRPEWCRPGDFLHVLGDAEHGEI